MALSLVILYLLPFLNASQIRSSIYRSHFKKVFWLIVFNSIILGWIGQQIVETPYIEIGQIATCLYFILFVQGFYHAQNYDSIIYKDYIKKEN